MYLKIHPETPSQRQIRRVADVLRHDGVIIYPTDTVYALGWRINNTKSEDKVSQIRKDHKKRTSFSLICKDLSQVSQFTKPLDKSTFKLLKHNLPGPFTFLLPASNKIPKLYKSNKNIVGIRIPDNNIPLQIVEELGEPIMTTSLRNTNDEVMDYLVDPQQIFEKYSTQVDVIIDGGLGNVEASTIVDCTNNEPYIIREGKGELVS
ncbi:MAG: threonylcarbamoyl-AMP synthase [Bacteroidales bacterium]|nr:threonylcarbamoyl-AMP synthase [Bacteroidales bacterium]